MPTFRRVKIDHGIPLRYLNKVLECGILHSVTCAMTNNSLKYRPFESHSVFFAEYLRDMQSRLAAAEGTCVIYIPALVLLPTFKEHLSGTCLFIRIYAKY